MAAVKELLRAETDGTLSFGDYTLDSKTKLDGFEFQGDIYKVKTFKEITKLEKERNVCIRIRTGNCSREFQGNRERSFV